MSNTGPLFTPVSSESTNPGRQFPTHFSSPTLSASSVDADLSQRGPTTATRLNASDLLEKAGRFVKRTDLHLTDSTFMTWQTTLEATASLIGIWDVIEEGLGPHPTADDIQRDIAARELIRFTCDAKNQLHLFGLKTSKECLSALRDIHQRTQMLDILRAKDELSRIVFVRGSRMVDHLRRIEEKVIKLATLGVKISDEEWCARIISSLERVYMDYTSIIQNFDSTPVQFRSRKSLVASLLTDDERRQAAYHANSAREAQGRVIHSAVSNTGARIICTHCKKPGHDETNCFVLHPEKRPQTRGQRPPKSAHNRRGRKRESCQLPGRGDSPSASSQGQPRKKEDKNSCSSSAFSGPSSVFFKPAISSIIDDAAWPNNVAEQKSINTVVSTAEYRHDTAGSSLHFLLDSGANVHAVSSPTFLINARRSSAAIATASGRINDTVIGDIVFDVGDGNALLLKDVHYAPSFALNILSIGRLASDGWSFTFSPPSKNGQRLRCLVTTPVGHRMTLTSASHHGALFHVDLQLSQRYYQPPKAPLSLLALNEETSDPPLPVSAPNSQPTNTLSVTWHQRLGHIGNRALSELRDHVLDLPANISPLPERCQSCVIGKMTREPFVGHLPMPQHALAVIYSDSAGPFPAIALGGYRYYCSFISGASRYSEIFLEKHKDEALGHFQAFQAREERRSGLKILQWITDRGGEFVSKASDAYCKDQGIKHVLTPPRTPQWMGVAEHLNRQLVENAITIMTAASAPRYLWGEAILYANYTRNRTFHSKVNCTPYEAYFGIKPSVKHLRVFGCLVFAHVHGTLRSKLDVHAERCALMGYDESSAYRLFSLESRRIVISRDVTFFEDKMAFLSVNNFIESEADRPIRADDLVAPIEPIPPSLDPAHEASSSEVSEEKERETVSEQDDVSDDSLLEEAVPPDSSPSIFDSSQHESLRTPPEFRRDRPSRTRRPTVPHWHAYATMFMFYLATASLMVNTDAPASFKEAITRPDSEHWISAMKREMDSLVLAGTWTMVSPPPGRKIIGSKWTYKYKNPPGRAPIYKARLVAQGFSQIPGIDFDETYSPVVSLSALRLILAVAAHLNLIVESMDVETAYLNGELEQEIYMRPPQGFTPPNSSHLVCRLKKSLYGLRQSGRAWNQRLDDVLISFGFKRLMNDLCIYIIISALLILLVAVYVDDIVVAGNNRSKLDAFKSYLSTHFKCKDLGALDLILGIRVTRDSSGGITLSQAHYVEAVLKRFGMTHCDVVRSPMDVNTFLAAASTEEPIMNHSQYREAVGCLMYLMLGTRPDLAFTVMSLARHSHHPTKRHWKALHRVFRFIRFTKDWTISYTGTDDGAQGLVAFSDADHAANKDDRRSITGSVITFANGPVAWSSKQQSSVALSSTEAEYMALTHTATSVVWLSSLLNELDLPQLAHLKDRTIVINMDNQSAIRMSKSEGVSSRSKHIDVRYHYIKEEIASGRIDVAYQPSVDLVADLLTKPLSSEQHERLSRFMGINTCSPLSLGNKRE